MSASIQELLRQLEDRDIKVEVIDDRLRVNAPKGALTADLRRALAEHKESLVSALKIDWAADARKVIQELPDEALRPVLVEYFEQTVAVIQDRHQVSREEAEKQSFGL